MWLRRTGVLGCGSRGPGEVESGDRYHGQGGNRVQERQHMAVEDRLEARDVLVRLITVVGLVGTAFVVLLIVFPA